MNDITKKIKDVFSTEHVKRVLPKLFSIAEVENSRGGKVGMNVGTTREDILNSLLIYYYGEDNVQVSLPINEPEVDVILFNRPISIKTTSTRYPKIALVWCSEINYAKTFIKEYQPTCDIILVRINWNGVGGVYFLTKELQQDIFNKIGRDAYLKFPAKGDKAILLTQFALKQMLEHESCTYIPINWRKDSVNISQLDRWIHLWDVM